MARTEADIIADGIAKEILAVEDGIANTIRSAAHSDLLEKVRTTGMRAHAEALVAALTSALEELAVVGAAAAKYKRKA